MKWIFLPVLGITFALSACQNRGAAIAFDETYFATRLSNVDRLRDQFVITVSPFSASAEGAREAGRYEATRYCIDLYGSSDVIWQAGPDAEPEALEVSNDTLTLRGACAPL